MSRHWFAALGAAAIALTAGLWMLPRPMAGTAVPPDVRAAWVSPPAPIASFALLDQDGASFGPEQLRGRWTLLFMGYTTCRDVCPITLNLMGRVARRLRDAPGGMRVQLAFLTADPARDTATKLKSYLSAFPDAVTGLTGNPAQVSALESQIGAFHRIVRRASVRSVSAGPGGIAPGREGYEVAHSADVYVIDPDGRLFARLRPPIDPETWAHRIAGLRAAYRDRSSG